MPALPAQPVVPAADAAVPGGVLRDVRGGAGRARPGGGATLPAGVVLHLRGDGAGPVRLRHVAGAGTRQRPAHPQARAADAAGRVPGRQDGDGDADGRADQRRAAGAGAGPGARAAAGRADAPAGPGLRPGRDPVLRTGAAAGHPG